MAWAVAFTPVPRVIGQGADEAGERPLLDAYGVPPDPDRTRYYRLLWDLGP